MLDVTQETLLRESTSILFQAQVCKYAKPEPIGVRHAIKVLALRNERRQ